MSIGSFPEILSQRILVRRILVCKLPVCREDQNGGLYSHMCFSSVEIGQILVWRLAVSTFAVRRNPKGVVMPMATKARDGHGFVVRNEHARFPT